MISALSRKTLRFVPAAGVVAAAIGLFFGTTAAIDRDEFLIYGYEIATFGLFAARGTGTALSVLAAGWLVWGAGKLAARLAASLSLMVTILTIWHQLYVPELPWNVISQYATSVVTFLGAAALFAFASRLGICFTSAASPVGRDLQKWQVSIRDLLVMITCVAIFLAMTRGALPRDLSNWLLSEDEILWLGLSCVSNLLIVATVVTCHYERRAWWLNLALSGCLTSAIAAMHIAALSRFLELPLVPLEPALAARGVHHGVLLTWLLGGLGALHLAGVRLGRESAVAGLRRLAMENVAAPVMT